MHHTRSHQWTAEQGHAWNACIRRGECVYPHPPVHGAPTQTIRTPCVSASCCCSIPSVYRVPCCARTTRGPVRRSLLRRALPFLELGSGRQNDTARPSMGPEWGSNWLETKRQVGGPKRGSAWPMRGTVRVRSTVSDQAGGPKDVVRDQRSLIWATFGRRPLGWGSLWKNRLSWTF